MSLLHKWFIYIILFLNGFQFILPVNYTSDSGDLYTNLPQWATRYEVLQGVIIADFLFIFYFLFFGYKYLSHILIFKKPLKFFLGIIGLSVSGVFSTFINFEILSDYFEAFKLILLALFFFYIFFWTLALGPVIVLRIFLIGLIISTLVNLYFTFNNPIRLIGGLPMLLGQNGPGGPAGFFMFLPAWFSVLSDKKIDILLIIIYILCASFLLVISNSKLGVLMGVLGLIATIVVQFRNASNRVRVKKVIYTIVFIFILFTCLFTTETGKIITDGAEAFYKHKVGVDSELIDSGDVERLYYYFAVGEIFIHNPIFGVGYNGFFDALIKTIAFKSGEMSEEGSSFNANPHNSFLYYISANGLLGLILTMYLYFLFCHIFYKYFRSYGFVGVIVVTCIVAASFIFTNTLIGFFSTPVMYIPVAVAYAVMERNCLNISFHKT